LADRVADEVVHARLAADGDIGITVAAVQRMGEAQEKQGVRLPAAGECFLGPSAKNRRRGACKWDPAPLQPGVRREPTAFVGISVKIVMRIYSSIRENVRFPAALIDFRSDHLHPFPGIGLVVVQAVDVPVDDLQVAVTRRGQCFGQVLVDGFPIRVGHADQPGFRLAREDVLLAQLLAHDLLVRPGRHGHGPDVGDRPADGVPAVVHRLAAPVIDQPHPLAELGHVGQEKALEHARRDHRGFLRFHPDPHIFEACLPDVARGGQVVGGARAARADEPPAVVETQQPFFSSQSK